MLKIEVRFPASVSVQLVETCAVCARCSSVLGGASAAQPASPWPGGNVMNINELVLFIENVL